MRKFLNCAKLNVKGNEITGLILSGINTGEPETESKDTIKRKFLYVAAIYNVIEKGK